MAWVKTAHKRDIRKEGDSQRWTANFALTRLVMSGTAESWDQSRKCLGVFP